jgi:hypothetical protein
MPHWHMFINIDPCLSKEPYLFLPRDSLLPPVFHLHSLPVGKTGLDREGKARCRRVVTLLPLFPLPLLIFSFLAIPYSPTHPSSGIYECVVDHIILMKSTIAQGVNMVPYMVMGKGLLIVLLT